jgi:hypothetical protein
MPAVAVRPGGHGFRPSGNVLQGGGGRTFRVCECGLTKRAAVHQPPDPRSVRRSAAPAVSRKDGPFLAATRDPDVPREVALLRLAADLVLALPHDRIGWTLRERAAAVRRACDLPPDEAPIRDEQVGAGATRTTRPSRRSDARWVRRALTGRYWDIAEAALDQGFEAQRTGNGHVRFCRGIYAFSLSTTVKEGVGHGYENAKAAARRAGVRV